MMENHLFSRLTSHLFKSENVALKYLTLQHSVVLKLYLLLFCLRSQLHSSDHISNSLYGGVIFFFPLVVSELNLNKAYSL